MVEICLACLLVGQTSSDEKRLKKAVSILEEGLKRRVDSEILFIKSLVLYLLGNYEESYNVIKEGIEKAEENIPSHYIMRGFSNLALKIYSEAVQDFTIALQLNDSLSMIYPYRGVCAYLSEDYSLALDDFVFYSKDFKTSSIVLSAKLLLFTASYPEALSLLSNASDTDEILTLRDYCNMMTSDYENCLKTLSKVTTIDVKNDILIIKNIINSEVSYYEPGFIFQNKYAL